MSPARRLGRLGVEPLISLDLIKKLQKLRIAGIRIVLEQSQRRPTLNPTAKLTAWKRPFEHDSGMEGIAPAETAAKRLQIGEAQDHRAEPSYRSDRPQFRAAPRDIVDVARILARADPNPRTALNLLPRILAPLASWGRRWL